MKPRNIRSAGPGWSASAKPAARPCRDIAARIEALLGDYDRPDAPGASVLVRLGGRTIFARGFGFADLEQRVPCSIHTNFRLASVTKPFTAMAVLMLAEQRKLSLAERLTDFFPEFPNYGRDITVRHLLTHTSGLPDYEDHLPAGASLPVLDQDVLRILLRVTGTLARETKHRPSRPLPLHGTGKASSGKAIYFPPGTRYRYSNTAYALLALIVEVRSGHTFAHFLQRHIFHPLRMTGTLAYEQGLSVVPHRAFGYSRRGLRFVRTDQNLTSSVLGDGGIYSSVADLARWDAALDTTRLVSARTLRAAFTPATPTDQPGRSYGFGWFIGEYRGRKEIWHSGDTIGFRTRLAHFPDHGLSVIALANRTEAMLDELPHRVADLVLWRPSTGP